MPERRTFFLWIDLEMSGLDPNKDDILEMAIIATDSNLTRFKDIESFHEYILPTKAYDEDEGDYTRDKLLGCLSDWCKIHLVENGLVDKLLDGNSVHVRQAETRAILYLCRLFDVPSRLLGKKNELKSWLKDKYVFHIAGNSIHADLGFIRVHMPFFYSLLHYRIVDVSTLKLLCQNWNHDISNNAPVKKTSHRAEDDILESLEELRYYRSKLFQ